MIMFLKQWLIKSYFYLLLLGLVIRLISIKTKGMQDVDVMINWGINISNLGWDEGYQAIYFPTSHIIFNTIVEIANSFSLEVFNLFTIVRLLSDILFLFLLLYLHRNGHLTQATVLFIWLNPLLIVLTLSGYTDTFSITLLASILVVLSLFQERKTLFFGLLSGFLIALFIFLKPQSLLLMGYLFFFIFLYVLLNLKSQDILKRVWILLLLTVPSLIIFGIYSLLISYPTKVKCVGGIGPRTIVSLENENLVKWDVCLYPEQMGLTYPITGPNICIEKQFEAFSPLGESGVCVKKYEYFLPSILADFGETGVRRLTNQILNGSAEHMPSYSANMPNFWHIYVVNNLNFDGNKEVWDYKADEQFNKLVWFFVLIFTLFYSIILFLTFRKKVDSYFKLISLVGFPVTFIIPIFATLAHENHFALGLFFSYLLVNLDLFKRNLFRFFHVLIFLISSVLALNVSRLYLWPMWDKSNDPFLQNIGGGLLELVTHPNIYQISLISTFASLVLLFSLLIGAFPRNQKPVAR
jgi:hypothetical protein